MVQYSEHIVELNFLSRCSDETTAFVRGSLEEIAESLETE